MSHDYYLQIDGVKGESTDKAHPDTIEIESFSWGASNPGSHGTGGGGGAGKVTMQDMNFTAIVSRARPELMLACATGSHYKKATLYVRKQGDGQKDYYTVTLEDLLVSSFSDQGSNGPLPVSNFSLNFAKIKFEYRPQRDDGSLEPAKTSGWDLKQNKPHG
jgi:type VI secretion system secreted protein Hcp